MGFFAKLFGINKKKDEANNAESQVDEKNVAQDLDDQPIADAVESQEQLAQDKEGKDSESIFANDEASESIAEQVEEAEKKEPSCDSSKNTKTDESSHQPHADQDPTLTESPSAPVASTKVEDTTLAEQAQQAAQAEQEAARLEAARFKAERIAAEKAEQERLEAERREAERIAAEKAEQERLEAERREAERIAAEKAEQERLEAERREAERIAAEKKAEEERLEAERREAERIAAEKAEQERREAERIAAEKAEQERLEAERLEAERIAAEKKAEEERLEAERLEAERIAAEKKAEEERLEAERLEAERIAAEKAEQERLEAERLEDERIAAEKAEQERLEAEAAAAAEAAEAEKQNEEAQAQENAEEAIQEERKSFFSRLKKTRDNLAFGVSSLIFGRKIDEDLYEDLETALLTADLGVETTQKVIERLRDESRVRDLRDAGALRNNLKKILSEILYPCEKPLIVYDHTPFVILMVGVNGAGKTTTIGKLARKYQDMGLKVMLAAGDTFRAAAVEQLKEWGERANVPVIAQATGSDSASVLYDAVSAAKARGIDVLLCDTAGRLQNKDHLMEELRKIVRVMQKIDPKLPHETMLVLDAATGQNAVSQTKVFTEAVNVTGLTLTKLDGSAKGGVVFSLANLYEIPIRYVGIGEKAEDLREFKIDPFVDALVEDEDHK